MAFICLASVSAICQVKSQFKNQPSIGSLLYTGMHLISCYDDVFISVAVSLLNLYLFGFFIVQSSITALEYLVYFPLCEANYVYLFLLAQMDFFAHVTSCS